MCSAIRRTPKNAGRKQLLLWSSLLLEGLGQLVWNLIRKALKGPGLTPPPAFAHSSPYRNECIPYLDELLKDGRCGYATHVTLRNSKWPLGFELRRYSPQVAKFLLICGFSQRKDWLEFCARHSSKEGIIIYCGSKNSGIFGKEI